MAPGIDGGNHRGDQRAMDADVGEKAEIDCEQYRARLVLTISVGYEKTEQRKENVAAGHDRILIGEVEAEGKDGPKIEREGREAQKDIDACGGDSGGDPAKDEITNMKMSWNPKDEIPERWMTLVAEGVEDQLRQAEITCEQPGLCFVVPRFVPGDGEREHDDVGQPYCEIPAFPTLHEDKFSRVIVRVSWRCSGEGESSSAWTPDTYTGLSLFFSGVDLFRWVKLQ